MKKRLRIILVSLLLIMFVSLGIFYLYVSDYYQADINLTETIKNEEGVSTDGNFTILRPSVSSDTGFIFYPGGKVEADAYLPLLDQLREQGITCILVKMPFHLAVFKSDYADKVYDKLPDIKNWYIGGHSLGGAMASSYASKNPDKIKGLILMGAYIYGNYPEDKTLILYGTEDSVLDKSKITQSSHVIPIEGGNHSQFGNYGFQKGDGNAAITAEQQQKITVDEIMQFVKSR